MGASPVGLVVMLYDGALRFMEQGKRAMAEGNLERQDYYLQKAQRIVTELMKSLDMQRGGEIARNLLGLYTFVQGELVTANIEDKPAAVDNAMRTMRELREGWVEIEKQNRNSAVVQVPDAA